MHPRFSSFITLMAKRTLLMYLPSSLILRPGGTFSSLFFIGPRMMIRASLHPQEIDLWGVTGFASQNPVMCILSARYVLWFLGFLGILEFWRNERNGGQNFPVILLNEFKFFVVCDCWLKILPRLKMPLSGKFREAKFRQLTLLNICLVPGTEGTGKTQYLSFWSCHVGNSLFILFRSMQISQN